MRIQTKALISRCPGVVVFFLWMLLLPMLSEAATTARGRQRVKRCGTPNPPLLVRRANQARLERRRKRHRELNVRPSCDDLCLQCISIDVYFHLLALDLSDDGVFLPHPTETVENLLVGNSVAREDFTTKEGIIPILNEQIAYLNQAYSKTPFSFVDAMPNNPLVHSTNNEWTFFAGDYSTEISQEYHMGNDTTLNVYLAFSIGSKEDQEEDGTTLGFASFPSFQLGSAGDGVFMRFDTLPGGGQESADLGETLVHEIGHWLGLYHIFQETEGTSIVYDSVVEEPCDPTHAGDFVSDTPQMSKNTDEYIYELNSLCIEETPEEACNATCLDYLDNPGLFPDTCRYGGDTTRDAVFNYMNYLDNDACFQEAGHFTCGQVERMYMHYKLFRDHVSGCATQFNEMEIEIVVSTDSFAGGAQLLLRQLNDDMNNNTVTILDSSADSLDDFYFLEDDVSLVMDLCVPRSFTYEFVVLDKPGDPDGTVLFEVWVDGVLVKRLQHDESSDPRQTVSIIAEPTTTSSPASSPTSSPTKSPTSNPEPGDPSGSAVTIPFGIGWCSCYCVLSLLIACFI